MYYFRDGYIDQQVAYGIARASLTCTYRPRRQTRRSTGRLLDLILPFVCIGVTFYAGLLVLDVLGLEHLVRAPSFEISSAYLEIARTFFQEAVDRVQSLVTS